MILPPSEGVRAAGTCSTPSRESRDSLLEGQPNTSPPDRENETSAPAQGPGRSQPANRARPSSARLLRLARTGVTGMIFRRLLLCREVLSPREGYVRERQPLALRAASRARALCWCKRGTRGTVPPQLLAKEHTGLGQCSLGAGASQGRTHVAPSQPGRGVKLLPCFMTELAQGGVSSSKCPLSLGEEAIGVWGRDRDAWPAREPPSQARR